MAIDVLLNGRTVDYLLLPILSYMKQQAFSDDDCYLHIRNCVGIGIKLYRVDGNGALVSYGGVPL